MGQIFILPEGKTIATEEGDRFEATQHLVVDTDGGQIKMRPGDTLVIGRKADRNRKIRQIP